jgi:DegV family protein with EDD domain
MPVMIDGQIYTEGLDDVQQELALALAMGKTVQTSRPAPGVFARVYRELAEAGYQDVVSIHLSEKLSGTLDAARLAAQGAPIPVVVVDSATVGLAQGFAVMDAAEALSAGAPAQAAADLARRAGRNTLHFTVPSLEQLRKGGRIGAASGLIGTLLAVKPILAVDGGQVVVREKVRTLPRALVRLVSHARETSAGGPGARIAVHYFGNEDQARELVPELEGSAVGEVLLQPLPAVLAAHSGAGVIGVVVAPLPGPGDGQVSQAAVTDV